MKGFPLAFERCLERKAAWVWLGRIEVATVCQWGGHQQSLPGLPEAEHGWRGWDRTEMGAG